jgi:hypothetical protein
LARLALSCWRRAWQQRGAGRHALGARLGDARLAAEAIGGAGRLRRFDQLRQQRVALLRHQRQVGQLLPLCGSGACHCGGASVAGAGGCASCAGAQRQRQQDRQE